MPPEADPARRELAAEAIFLGRMLTKLLPDEPEAWGLLALMLYAEARKPARRTAEGEFVPLKNQDKALWDWGMIEEAEAALHYAIRARLIGRYQLEAAIQSAHVEGARVGSVSWAAIVSLYDALLELTKSPVACINRSLASGRATRDECWIGGFGGCRRGQASEVVSAILGRSR